MSSDSKIIPYFFPSAAEFRLWLEANHQTESELLVGYYKVGTKKPSVSWSESVDEALCFGWIDGIRRSVDEESYCIRFTPRNPKSNWSAVNLAKVETLTSLGKMTAAGLTAFEKRLANKSAVYSYETHPEKLSADFEKQLRENLPAWGFFMKQAPSYRKTMIYWVMNAKQESTRQARLKRLIAFSAENQRVF